MWKARSEPPFEGHHAWIAVDRMAQRACRRADGRRAEEACSSRDRADALREVDVDVDSCWMPWRVMSSAGSHGRSFRPGASFERVGQVSPRIRLPQVDQAACLSMPIGCPVRVEPEESAPDAYLRLGLGCGPPS